MNSVALSPLEARALLEIAEKRIVIASKSADDFRALINDFDRRLREACAEKESAISDLEAIKKILKEERNM